MAATTSIDCICCIITNLVRSIYGDKMPKYYTWDDVEPPIPDGRGWLELAIERIPNSDLVKWDDRFKCTDLDGHFPRLVYKESRTGARLYRYQCYQCHDILGMVKTKDVPDKSIAKPLVESYDYNRFSRLTDQEKNRRELEHREFEIKINAQRALENRPPLGLNRDQYREWYHNTYLKSDHWQNISQQKRIEAQFRCQLCNSGEKLQVHHRTYERVGKELLSDLTALCGECHDKFHKVSKVKDNRNFTGEDPW